MKYCFMKVCGISSELMETRINALFEVDIDTSTRKSQLRMYSTPQWSWVTRHCLHHYDGSMEGFFTNSTCV